MFLKQNKVVAILIISLFILCSCNSVQLPSTYKYNSRYIWDELVLMEDSTFIYTNGSDLGPGTTAGRFSVRKNRLKLKSYDEYFDFLVSEEFQDSLNGEVLVKINGFSHPVDTEYVYIKVNNEVCYLDNSGQFKTCNIKVRQLSLNYYPYCYEYKIENKKSNCFIIEFTPDNMGEFHLNRIYKIRGKRLIPKDGGVTLKIEKP